MTTLDMNYNPPEKDPHAEGTQHWDMIRTQLMLTRDELTHTKNECAIKDGRIADLTKDIERLEKLREADRNECVSLRTTLQNLGSMLLTGMRKAEEDRKKADPYAPPATLSEPQGEAVSQEDQDSIESTIARLGRASFAK